MEPGAHDSPCGRRTQAPLFCQVDVRETFGQVKWIVLEGQDEFAVLTGEMTEAEFMAAAEKVAGLRQKIVVRT